MVSDKDESRVWATLAGDASLARYLPHLTFGAAEEAEDPELARAEERVALLWCAALLVLLACDRLAAHSERADRAFGSLALPLLLFFAVAIGVDGWARPKSTDGEPPALEGSSSSLLLAAPAVGIQEAGRVGAPERSAA